jgi:hypothetical protein
MEKLRRICRRHPLVRDAFLWAIPALFFGAVLRALLMSYLPYAFWGPDSRSYYAFAHKLLLNGWISLGDKRRFLYPILLVPVSLLPGGALRWLPLIQHTLGLATLLPLAYVIRKTLRFWRVWIVPLTVTYAGIPIVLWSEHELLAENVFFATLTWAFAGWAAWVGQEQAERSRRLFWWFLVPFALFILTKPAGRFVWPGIFVGLALVAAWRLLTGAQAVALLAVLAITPVVGSKKQGAWLLYTAAFPLTQLETPLHAEYKAEVRDLVMRMRDNLDIYYLLQHEEPFYFLRDPDQQTARPLWTALGKTENEKLKNKIYMDLALEGMKARPDLFLYLALERIVATGNFSDFGGAHFSDGSFSSEFAEYYKEAVESQDSPIRLALALPKKGPVPPYEEYRRKLEPAPGSWGARAVRACVGAYGRRFDLFRFPDLPKEQCKVSLVRPTFLCAWLFVGALLSVLPRYRRTLGVWTIVAVGYVWGVFLVSVVNSRYFAPVWPVLLPLLAVPAEVIWALVASRWAKPVEAGK